MHLGLQTWKPPNCQRLALADTRFCRENNEHHLRVVRSRGLNDCQPVVATEVLPICEGIAMFWLAFAGPVDGHGALLARAGEASKWVASPLFLFYGALSLTSGASKGGPC